jgi:peptidoglycan/LPS O-acetylase OafA/YrhL
MWRRFLRIFPGLWACLIVTVTLFVSIALFDEGKGIFSGLASRASYVGIKGLLVPGFAGIARTLANVPYANAWNGSLWTLPVEFICYIAIACLLSIALVRRNRAILIAVFLVASAIDMVAVELSFPIAAQDVVGLTTCFIAGSLLYVYRDRVLFNTSLGLLALAILLVAVVFAQAGAVVALPLAYLCLWLGVVLPLRSVGRANDFSYGVYIYAFPVAQLLAVFGATKLGVASCIGLTIALTYPLAVASWFAVERPAMRLKTMRLPRRRELVGDRSDITATAQRSKVRSEIPTR